jgi:hypothetical protein
MSSHGRSLTANLITFHLFFLTLTLLYVYHANVMHIAPQYQWKRLDTNEWLRNSPALMFPNGLNRTDKGVYSCIVENKHGSNVANITMNILCEYTHIFLFLPPDLIVITTYPHPPSTIDDCFLKIQAIDDKQNRRNINIHKFLYLGTLCDYLIPPHHHLPLPGSLSIVIRSGVA